VERQTKLKKPKPQNPANPMDDLFKGMPGHVLDVKNRFQNLRRAAERKKFAADLAAANAEKGKS